MGRLFSFVVTLVVVGTCLFVATRIAIGPAPERDKPATLVPRRGRGQDPNGDPKDDEGPGGASGRRRGPTTTASPGAKVRSALDTPVWRRLRSVVLLAALLTVLGLILAVAIAIFGAVVLNGLRSAVQ